MFKIILKSVIFLAIAAVLFVFSNGHYIIPIALWIAPVFMIRFLRMHNVITGAITSSVLFYITTFISWYKLIPVPINIYLLIILSITFTVTSCIPLIIDRVLYKKVDNFLSTLILPLSCVAIEFIYVLTSPFGTTGINAITQIDNIVLSQIASITGVYGITFVIFWFASTVNWIIDNDFRWDKIRNGVALFLIIFFAIMIYGGIKTNVYKVENKTVRISGILPDRFSLDEKKTVHDFYNKLEKKEKPSLRDIEKVKPIFENRIFDLIEKTEREALAGSKIICWSEVASMEFIESENSLIEKGCNLAKKNGIYLLMTAEIIDMEAPGKFLSNKVYFIDPSGKLLLTYLKSIQLLGSDSETTINGDGSVIIFDTPYGKISTMICLEADFYRFVAKVKKCDILFIPSNDWKAIDPIHTKAVSLLAIEYGFNVVRSTSNGLSAIYDFNGNLISKTDYFTTDDKIITSNVPTKGITTVYSIIGDLFAYLCMLGLILIIVFIIIQNIKKKD